MHTHIEFKSDAFSPYPGEEETINPGIWGKRLAEFISLKLPEHGVTVERICPEDWGVAILIRHDAFPMFIGCGNQTDAGGNRFLCFIDPSKPEVRRGLFNKVSTVSEVERVADALEAILRSHPGVTNLRWWDEDELP